MSTLIQRYERMAHDLRRPDGRRVRYTKLENEISRLELKGNMPDHILEQLDRARELRGPFEPRGSLNTWSETLYSSTVNETALTAAAETAIFPVTAVPGWYGFIPGGYMIPHRTIHLRCAGQVTTGGTQGTYLWKIKWGTVVGGTVLVASNGAGATGATLAPTALLTNSFWRAEFYITARADIGTAAGLFATGILEGDVIPSPGAVYFPKTAPAAVNADTSAGNSLTFTLTPSNTNNTYSGMQYTLESMN
jgi:hypothetical protein